MRVQTHNFERQRGFLLGFRKQQLLSVEQGRRNDDIQTDRGEEQTARHKQVRLNRQTPEAEHQVLVQGRLLLQLNTRLHQRGRSVHLGAEQRHHDLVFQQPDYQRRVQIAFQHQIHLHLRRRQVHHRSRRQRQDVDVRQLQIRPVRQRIHCQNAIRNVRHRSELHHCSDKRRYTVRVG